MKTKKNNFFITLLFFVLSSTCQFIVSSEKKEVVTGRTILHNACIGYTQEEVRQLLLLRGFPCREKKNDENNSTVSCQTSWVKKILFSNSHHINVQDSDGNTPLHLVCINDAKIDIVNSLLAVPDIDVNVQNKYGDTPLHWACDGGARINVVKALCEHKGIDTEKKNNEGYTAYDLARRSGAHEVTLLFNKKIEQKPVVAISKKDYKFIHFLLVVVTTFFVLQYTEFIQNKVLL